MSLLGTPWSTGQHHIQFSASQTLLTTALTPVSIMVTTPILPLVIKCHHMARATLGSNDPHCIYVSNSVAAAPTIISDLKRRVTTDSPRVLGLPSHIYFSQWYQRCLLDPPRIGKQNWCDKSPSNRPEWYKEMCEYTDQRAWDRGWHFKIKTSRTHR